MKRYVLIRPESKLWIGVFDAPPRFGARRVRLSNPAWIQAFEHWRTIHERDAWFIQQLDPSLELLYKLSGDWLLFEEPRPLRPGLPGGCYKGMRPRYTRRRPRDPRSGRFV